MNESGSEAGIRVGMNQMPTSSRKQEYDWINYPQYAITKLK